MTDGRIRRMISIARFEEDTARETNTTCEYNGWQLYTEMLMSYMSNVSCSGFAFTNFTARTACLCARNHQASLMGCIQINMLTP